MMTSYHKGMLLTGLGVLLVSPDAMFIRLINVPAMDLLFWRGTMLAMIMFLFIALQDRQNFNGVYRRFSLPVLYIAAIYTLLNFLFIFAVTHASAASVLTILAATPLFAGIIGWLFLKERLAWQTWGVIIIVFLLIIGIAGDALIQNTGLGIAAAIGAALLLAGYFTMFRIYPDLSRRYVFLVSGISSAIIGAALSTPFDFNSHQMTLTLIMTIFVMPPATILMTLGPRYLPAAEIGLLVLLESVLGPLWVFLAVGEVPSMTTILCGGAILFCVALHFILGRHRAVG